VNPQMSTMSKKFSANLRIDAAGLFACAVLTFAAYLAGAEPLVRRHDQAIDTAEQLSRERQRHQELLASNRDLKNRVTTIEQGVAKADITLQPARLVNQRIAALTALAVEAGLEVQSINTTALVPGQRYSQVPIHMIANGSYQTSAAFLHRLRAKCHDVSVTGFDVSDNLSETQPTFSVDLVWYVLPTSK